MNPVNINFERPQFSKEDSARNMEVVNRWISDSAEKLNMLVSILQNEETHADATGDSIILQNEETHADATGDSIGEATMNFTSSDVADGSAAEWTSVPALASGEKHNAILGKVSQMFKNVRYLFKILGTTDISGIGDGTATGAISSLNADLAKKAEASDLAKQSDSVKSNTSAISTLSSELAKKAAYYIVNTSTSMWSKETCNVIRDQIVKSGAIRIDGIGIFNGYTSAYSVAARADYQYVGILFFSYSDFLTIANTSDSGNSWVMKNITAPS